MKTMSMMRNMKMMKMKSFAMTVAKMQLLKSVSHLMVV